MDPFREIIDISDEDGDGTGSSIYGFDEDLLLGDNEIGNDAEALTIKRPSDRVPDGIRNLFDNYESCLQEIVGIFPDISHEHVQKIYNDYMGPNPVAQALIEKILDSGTYPKEKDRMRELKRKRNDKEIDEEETAKWKYMDLRNDPAEYARVAKASLQEAFDHVPARFIQDTFKEHGHYYGAFFAILKAEREYDPPKNLPFSRLKTRRLPSGVDAKTLMINLQTAGFDFETLKKEMDSAFQRRKREDSIQLALRQAEQAEAAEDQERIANGEVMDCGCCCETVTVPRMTHCNGDEPHFFCLDCARKNANNDIGNSQYKLKCMDFSDCTASFSREQRIRFLDEKTIEKLERLQQQQEIRLAELDNLSTCPFCDFAAICPPVEEDREFRCHNPQCEEVSCRLCKLKSHIPLSCEEHKKEFGISERRVIEEARTEALIRTCGKCKVRILKEDGCNKVICTSCYAVLCDYCGKDISKVMYNHFDGEGGRAPPGLITVPGGKCPLYDESNKRKDLQVNAAEKEAMGKVRAEHPELSEEDLKIRFAKGIERSPSKHHRPHGLNHAWAAPLNFPFQPDAGEGHQPIIPPGGPRFYPPYQRPETLAPAALEAPEEMGERLQRRQQHAQHAAYQAYLQVQQQRQQAQQQRVQQQLVQQQQTQQQQQLNQHRMQQRLQQRAQAKQNDVQIVRAGLERHREALFGVDAAADRAAMTNDGMTFNPFDDNEIFDRPNRPLPHPFNLPVYQHANGADARHQAAAARLNARRGDQADRHARLNRPEAPDPLVYTRQRREPREPTRRNAVDYSALPNPWA